jgi:hypothetical protein
MNMGSAAKKSNKPVLPPNAFIGHAAKPRHAELAHALHGAVSLWDDLVAGLETEFGLKQEWNSYSTKYGWSLRLKKKDRNVVYLVPCAGEFAVTIILGAKALSAARQELPDEIFAGAMKYPEGTAIRVPIRSQAEFAFVRRLVAAKLA